MGKERHKPRRFDDEFKERAVRLVLEWRRARDRDDGGLTEVGQQLGVHQETFRNWVNRADVDAGRRQRTKPSPTRTTTQVNSVRAAVAAAVRSRYLDGGSHITKVEDSSSPVRSVNCAYTGDRLMSVTDVADKTTSYGHDVAVVTRVIGRRANRLDPSRF